LKARVDLGDQTAEFIPFEVINTATLTYFYLPLGTHVRILVSVINNAFNQMRRDSVVINPCVDADSGLAQYQH
jgi:hypothetical protein